MLEFRVTMVHACPLHFPARRYSSPAASYIGTIVYVYLWCCSELLQLVNFVARVLRERALMLQVQTQV